ncbi:MAG: T9SS type A sorting domain-containing protein, partial [Flavobacteriales bacterium]
GPAQPGTPCDDLNACTTNDVYQTNCSCAGTFQDTDNDGICNASDNCPNTPGMIGSPCDDLNPGTTGDVIGSNCVCAGVPTGCNNNLELVFNTDSNGGQTSWEILPIGSAVPSCSGGGLESNALVSAPCCLPDGCYRLRVLDSAGDGMTSGGFTGGYVLQTQGTNQRIIDNRNNFSTGSTSAISGQQGLCLPLGADKLISTSCDKLDWVSGNYVVANANPAVSAQWLVGDQTDDGYEFWFFNPNGGYSFRKFRNHAVSDGFGPASATRACHIKINNWAAADQIPANTLMNVRIRSRVNGVNSSWGSACRFMIDPVRAACPLTKLNDIPGQQFLSCGATRAWGNGNYVHARPVTGATQYQFRFRIDAEGFLSIRTVSTYFVQLNWITFPLQNGKNYKVEVRAFKNGAWCIDSPTPAPGPNFVQWGDVCDLTIDNTPANGGNENMLGAGQSEQSEGLRMYPNPNRGDQLYLSLDAVEDGVQTVSVDIFDLTGKRVSARTIAVQDGFVNTVLDLDGDMANGMYMVNITAGSHRYTERLVISK